MKRYAPLIAACLLAACDDALGAYTDVPTPVYRADILYGTPIASAEEFAKIGMDDEYPLDGEYYLADDIDLAVLEEDWAPVGPDDAAPFSGVLVGNGKTVRGLALAGGGAVYTGLFGYLLYAHISDLTIEAGGAFFDKKISLTDAASDQYIGAAAGYIKNSRLDGITITSAEDDGVLEIDKTGTKTTWAGGLAGRLENSVVSGITAHLGIKAKAENILYAGLVAGEQSGGNMTSCSAAGSVEAYSTGGTGLYAGGLAGKGSSINDCTSAVTLVYAETTSTGAYIGVFAGGIAGDCADTSGCSLNTDADVVIYAKNSTSSGNNGDVAAGGIAGAGSINNCVVYAPVSITAETAGYSMFICAGGIVGRGYSISNCFIRRGKVLAKMTSTAVTEKLIATGGIAGYCTSAISNCFSGANVTVESALKANLASNSATATGGIVGYVTSGANIENSVSSGTVSLVSSSAETGGKAFAGGIAGFGSYNAGIAIKQSVALNPSVTVECDENTAPYAYRILGGVPTAYNTFTVPDVSEVPGISTLTLQNNYALPDMTVQTKTGTNGWTDVPQSPNNMANLMGDDNMLRTQSFFEDRLGWNFDTAWEWDDSLNAPIPRVVRN
ncbi:MAG: hypothetical protein LBJ86_01340 [Spirochaetaceae bacterium]|jgi:hypothetical protein|nr:hypothetical protein [Spirochaetaceae bacterium]